MKEAKKLDADDIINVRVDVKRTINETNTVFDYTGTALAIKYTTSKDVSGHVVYESMAAKLPEETKVVKVGWVYWVLGGLGALLLLIGAAAN
jgi:hypothetical protein